MLKNKIILFSMILLIPLVYAASFTYTPSHNQTRFLFNNNSMASGIPPLNNFTTNFSQHANITTPNGVNITCYANGSSFCEVELAIYWNVSLANMQQINFSVIGADEASGGVSRVEWFNWSSYLWVTWAGSEFGTVGLRTHIFNNQVGLNLLPLNFTQLVNYSNNLTSFRVRGSAADEDFSIDNFNFTLSFTDQATVSVLLENPPDNFANTSSSQTFRCSASSANLIDNVTFSLWDSASAVEATTFRNLANAVSQNESFAVTSITNDTYKWNCDYTTTLNDRQSAGGGNFTFILDTQTPTIRLEHPRGLYQQTAVSLNFTSNDTNKNTCFYSIGGAANTTVSSCANVSITANRGDNQLIFYVNDTAGNIANNQTNFTVLGVPLLFYNSEVVERSLQPFSLFIQNGSAILTDALFRYNSSFYAQDTITNNGTGIYLNRSVNAPTVDTTSRLLNQSFLWNLTFTRDGYNLSLNSTYILNQTVYQIYIGNCSDTVSTTQTLNFTALHETTNGTINITTSELYTIYPGTDIATWNRSFSFQIVNGTTNTTNFARCIFPVYANVNSTAFVQYTSNGFTTRDFVKSGLTLSNATRFYDLFLIPTSLATDITVTLTDSNSIELPNYQIEVERYNIVGDYYNLVESGTTDLSGKTVFNLVQGDVFYRFKVYLNGVLLLTTQKQKITSTTLTIQLSTTSDKTLAAVINLVQLSTTISDYSNITQNISISWSDPNNVAGQIRIQTERQTISNKTILYQQIITNDTGQVIQHLGNTTANYLVTIYAVANIDNNEYEVNHKSFYISESIRIFGKEGLIWGSLIMITIVTMAAAFGPVTVILGTMVSIIIVTGLEFIPLSTGVIMGLIAGGIALVIRMRF